jgi:hypothetical protein
MEWKPYNNRHASIGFLLFFFFYSICLRLIVSYILPGSRDGFVSGAPVSTDGFAMDELLVW